MSADIVLGCLKRRIEREIKMQEFEQEFARILNRAEELKRLIACMQAEERADLELLKRL